MMPEYRAYVLDRCETEGAARERAKLLVDGHDVELWLGTRRIATFRHLNS